MRTSSYSEFEGSMQPRRQPLGLQQGRSVASPPLSLELAAETSLGSSKESASAPKELLCGDIAVQLPTLQSLDEETVLFRPDFSRATGIAGRRSHTCCRLTPSPESVPFLFAGLRRPLQVFPLLRGIFPCFASSRAVLLHSNAFSRRLRSPLAAFLLSPF